MIWCFKVKLSLCRGPIEGAGVVVAAIEEDLMEPKTKINQTPGEVTTGEGTKEGEAEGFTIISISIMCRMGSVAALPTSMLNKTWALSSST
jgi:hypothetical protein